MDELAPSADIPYVFEPTTVLEFIAAMIFSSRSLPNFLSMTICFRTFLE
jgi:hypothetical protein